MHGTRGTGHIRMAATIVAMAFALGGCEFDQEATSNEEILEESELSGSVGDGPIVGAAMRVLRNDGKLLGEIESDASASYNILIRTKGKYYPLTIVSTGGTDLVTNQAPDFGLLGAALDPGKKNVANVNPFSTLAVEVARDLPGGINKTNLLLGQDYAVSALSAGLSTLMASGPMGTRIDGANIAEMVKSAETLAEIIRRTRDLQLMFSYPSSGDAPP